MKIKSAGRRHRAGLTLIEVLLVLVILVILGSLVGVAVNQQRKRAMNDAAKVQIKSFEQSLKVYALDNNKLPTTSEGLQAMVERPADANPDRWKKVLDSKTVPLDPWDNPYQYELQDDENFRVWSWGPDGTNSTDDDVTGD